MKQVKILLADNSFLIRQGFCSVIQETKNLVLVGEAERAEDLSEKLLLTQPDVLIIDYSSAYFCPDDISVVKDHFQNTNILAGVIKQCKLIHGSRSSTDYYSSINSVNQEDVSVF